MTGWSNIANLATTNICFLYIINIPYEYSQEADGCERCPSIAITCALITSSRITDALIRILNLNSDNAKPAMSPSGSKDQTEAAYKVLIMDKFARELVAPLLRVQDLRKHGVTLHLALESDRQPIPDVPAIYLMQPTPFNIERVASDASSSLYESMHLNFTSLLPTRVMEQLATAVVKTGHAGKITKLFDQYLSFVALEPGLFSLGLPDTYLQLNDPTANDNQIEAAVSTIVEGLFSACVTLGVVPIIRCPR